MILQKQKILNYNIIEYDSITSTMDVIKEYPDDTVVIAKNQTSGRGKNNNVWISDSNNNLLATLKIKINSNKDYDLVVFITNISMRESIEKFSKEKHISILSKLHNDVLVNNKKVCGILLEQYLDSLLIGFGVNIDYYPQVERKIFQLTSLKENGIIVNKYELLKEFLTKFNHYMSIWKNKGFECIKKKFLDNLCFKLNDEIEIKGKIGIFKNLDNDGILEIETNDGEIQKIKAGDIFKN